MALVAVRVRAHADAERHYSILGGNDTEREPRWRRVGVPMAGKQGAQADLSMRCRRISCQ